MERRYSIEYDDDMVLIYGTLTIEEAFDFISFYDKKGFNEIGVGHENSTLCLHKYNLEKKRLSEEKFSEVKEDLKNEISEKNLIISDLKKHIENQKHELNFVNDRLKLIIEHKENILKENIKLKTELNLKNSGFFTEKLNGVNKNGTESSSSPTNE